MLTCRVCSSGMFLFDGMNDITVPEYCISRIDLGHWNYALVQSQVWVRFRRRLKRISSSDIAINSRKIWSWNIYIVLMHRWDITSSIKYYDISELTELPVIGIVYVFRVRRHCWAEERPQNGVCIREQKVRENTKSALGWTGLTGLNYRVQQNPPFKCTMAVNKITSKRAILGMLWRYWTDPVCHTESFEHPSGLQERTGHDLSNCHLKYSRNISWRTGLPISRSFLLRNSILNEKQIDGVKQKYYDAYRQHEAPRTM